MLNDEVRELRSRYESTGHGHLFHNLLLFSRILREMGLDANPTRTINLLQSIVYIGLGNKEDFYEAGKAIMLRHNDEQPVYDYVFQVFWRNWPSRETKGVTSTEGLVSDLIEYEEKTQEPGETSEEAQFNTELSQDSDALPVGEGKTVKQVAEGESDTVSDDSDSDKLSFSADDSLATKDFQDFTREELDEARRLMSALRWRLSERPSRRMAPSHHGRRLDGRRTVRKALKYGGIPLELAHRERKHKPRPLVLICDISGSMDLYSRLLLQFMHSMESGLKHTETFVFGTRLTRITYELKIKNIDQALFSVSKVVKDWAGGTRIGESLAVFNRKWARRVLGHGAVVILISDGWDKGSIEVLRQEIARLQRMSYRLIWLDPLLGLPDYRPLNIGIQAAQDNIDYHLPAHNFESLEKLSVILQNIGDTNRSERKQQRNTLTSAVS